MATLSDETLENTKLWQDPLHSPHAMQAVINQDATRDKPRCPQGAAAGFPDRAVQVRA